MKKDSSDFVSQREKLKSLFVIKNRFAWTQKQQKFLDLALDKNTKIMICKSPAGTGKTALSIYCSLLKLSEKKVGEIIYVRAPVESCSKGIGYLQGDKSEKMNPYLAPAMDHLREFLDKSAIDNLIKDKRLQIEPFGFIKGRTFNVSAIIADEAEDFTTQELELMMCRPGRFSILFLIGDVRQSNIKNSGFNKVFNAFNTTEARIAGIHTFEFTKEDCMRSPITSLILDVFEKID